MKFKYYCVALALSSTTQIHAQTDGSQYLNKENYRQDTTYNDVNLNGKSFKVTIVYDLFDSNHESLEDQDKSGPAHLLFQDNTNKIVSVIDYKDPEGNYPMIGCNLFKICDRALSGDGNLYMGTYISSGGSGSKSEIILLEWKDGIVTKTTVLTYGGLDFILYNKNGKSLLVIRGIWGDGETHFANHKVSINEVAINNGFVTKREIGNSKYKYQSLDENENQNAESLFKSIKSKEPNLLTNYNLSNYCK